MALAFLISALGLYSCGASNEVAGDTTSRAVARYDGLFSESGFTFVQRKIEGAIHRPLSGSSFRDFSSITRGKFGRFASYSAGRARDSIVLSDDNGGQFGVDLPTSSSWSGWIGAIYAYTDGTVNLATPPPTTPLSPTPGPSMPAGNELYAPTTHVTGTCFEIGTSYYRQPTGSSTDVNFYVYDACGVNKFFNTVLFGSGAVASFLNSYAVTPGYQPSVFIVAVLKSSDGRSVAFIYNNRTNLWDYLRDSAADSTQSAEFPFNTDPGWTMFETHYRFGGCSYVPQIPGEVQDYFTINANASPIPVGPPSDPFSAPTAYPFNGYSESALTTSDVKTKTSTKYCASDDHTPGSYFYSTSIYGPGAWSVFSNAD